MTDHEQPAAGVALDLATGSQARIQCSTCHQPANPAHYCDHHNGGPWCDECWKVGDCAEVHGAGCRTTVWEPMDPEFSDGLDRAFLSAEAPTDAGGAVSDAAKNIHAAAPINPDGPEAARCLRSLAADRDKAVGLLRDYSHEKTARQWDVFEARLNAFLSSQTEGR